jgi:acetylornithine deacetylase/succinyl-diaminopimelate desuccinylase family protein
VPGADVVELAARLVRIRSENPPGRTREACGPIAEALGPAGFDVELFEQEEGAASLVATHAFPEPGPTLLLNGHLDVVPVDPAGGWRGDPWSGQVLDGRLYGRGSLDMKGALAALVVAARTVVTAGAPLRGRLVVCAVADEEQGGALGAGALVAAGKVPADAALVAEPGNGGLVIAHRGLCFVRLTTRGRSGHASLPARAVNAVEAMVDALAACRDVELRHAPHPLLGAPGVAVGTTIRGGEKVNVIPDRCTATLDVRTVPGMTREGVVEDLRAAFRRRGLAAERWPEIEILVWGGPSETPPETEIVRVAADAFESEFGRRPELRGMPAATDGHWFSEAGIPTVMALGPGRIEDCHVVDESVDVEELVRYARVYAGTVTRFLGGAGLAGANGERGGRQG